MIAYNEEFESDDYLELKDAYRPSHFSLLTLIILMKQSMASGIGEEAVEHRLGKLWLE